MGRRKSVEVVLTEISGQIAAVNVKIDSQGRHTEQMAGTLTDLLGRVESRVTDLEQQKPLAAHSESKNPHPNQEEWLGARFAKQGGEISALREDVTTLKTTFKFWGIVGALVAGVASPLLVHYLGG